MTMDTIKLTDCFEEILNQDKEYQKLHNEKVFKDSLLELAINTSRKLDSLKDLAFSLRKEYKKLN